MHATGKTRLEAFSDGVIAPSFAATASPDLPSVPPAWVSVWLSVCMFVLVPLLSFMPGRTIERLAVQNNHG